MTIYNPPASTQGAGGSSAGWSRPSDWLALPAVSEGEQKFVGLHAVYDHDSNFCALSAAGAYTVDWGDGSAPENVATGVQANHNFVWANVSSGTLTSGGYRQAVVTVTMQAAQTFTILNLLLAHSQAGLNAYSSGWLDIRMAGASLAGLTVGSTAGTPIAHRMLQQFEYVGASAITSMSGKLSTCRSLGSVVGTSWTASVTDFTSMFESCKLLATIPLLNTAAGTNFTSMFNGCSALQSIPLLSTAAGTNFSTMFGSCTALQSCPLLNTAAGTNFTSMFNSCSALPTIPLLNTAAGTNFTSMFSTCSALQTIPLLNTAAGTVFTTMFSNCTSLAVGALAGTRFSINYASCKLSATELNRIYTNLASGVTAQTITVSTNWGTTGDDPTIATGKGWTVTG